MRLSAEFGTMKKSRSAKNIVGSQVRRIRTEVEISQTELAAECQRQDWDVSRDVIAKIEDGRRWVADEELIRLAKALVCPVPALFPEEAQSCLQAFFRPAYGEETKDKVVNSRRANPNFPDVSIL